MNVSHLECPRCSTRYQSEQLLQLCQCGSPLFVRYHLDRISQSLKKQLKQRPNSLWRYREFLPLRNPENIISFDEGMTPLVKLKKVGSQIGLSQLYLKNESVVPTGSFKARGATVGVSRARELGVNTLIMPTNGNAGGAWSAYCAAAGIRAVIVMPVDAPEIHRKECDIAGAELFLVNGLLNDAGRIVSQAVEKYGWFEASTLKEPYRVEGKKTLGLEITEQLNWKVPDVILYPTGGGVGMIGIHKALRELQIIGWIPPKMPRFVAVQSAGCAPLVKAFKARKRETEFWENASTIAFGLNVPKLLGDTFVMDIVYETNGCAVAVLDSEIMAMQREIASQEGIFVGPEGAATLAAAEQLRRQGWIRPDENVVTLNTASGLKYADRIESHPPLLMPNEEIRLKKVSPLAI